MCSNIKVPLRIATVRGNSTHLKHVLGFLLGFLEALITSNFNSYALSFAGSLSDQLNVGRIIFTTMLVDRTPELCDRKSGCLRACWSCTNNLVRPGFMSPWFAFIFQS